MEDNYKAADEGLRNHFAFPSVQVKYRKGDCNGERGSPW